MKKAIVLLMALFLSLSAIAQVTVFEEGTNTLAGFGNVMTNEDAVFDATTGIMYTRFLQDGLGLRLQARVGYAKDKLDAEDKDYNINSEVLVGAGLQKSLVTGKRLNGYVGADALLGSYAEKDIYTESSTVHSTTEFGVRPFMGIQLGFDTHFFVGLEWGYDILFNNSRVKYGDTIHKLSRNTIVDMTDLSSLSLRIGYAF